MRLKRICKHAWKRLVAMALVIAMLNTSVGPVSVQAEDIGETGVDDPQTVTLYPDDANGNTGNTDGNEESGEESGDAADTSGSAGNTETEEQGNVPAEQNVYDSGLIRIYNLEQLEAVGTGAQVYSGDDSADTFGTGDAVTDENGSAVVYGNDAAYMLMNEISLDSSDLWQLPAGFAGSFTGTGGNAGSPLYDAETDTIYIYNNYQLGTANDPEALKTVMSNDMIAEEFGMGQIVFADEAEETQLEYTDAHNYVLTTDFTSEMPELKAAEVQDEVSVQLGGREFIGQSAMKIDGETYILIGNEKQLRAIGDDVAVVPMYFKRERVWGTDYKLKPYYPGDADLNITTLSDAGIEKDDIKFDSNSLYNITGIEGDSFEKHTDLLNDSRIGDSVTHVDSTKYVITIDENGDKKLTADSESNEEYIKLYKDLKYTNDANYIIFRDIDFSTGEFSDGSADNLWDPLMFHGTMIGAENMTGIDVQAGQFTDEVPVSPVLSNISVEYSDTKLNMNSKDAKPGMGFFATVGSRVGNSTEDLFKSKDHVKVENLTLEKIDVESQASEIADPPGTVLETLIKLLDWTAGLLLRLLGLGSVSDLLNALISGSSTDMSNLATGCFAGKIFGDVEIINCKVIDGNVDSAAGMSGGFAGTVEGLVEYDIASNLLGGIVTVLGDVLDLIPFLGLGNLVDNLLNGGVLDVGDLIPTGYHSAVLKNCSVEGINEDSGILGKDTTELNGAFAGKVRGAILQSCEVIQDTDLTIKGAGYVGGFAGELVNHEVNGLLDDLDITSGDDYWPGVVNQSVAANCVIRGNGTITVEGTGNYVGGFTGLLANSYAVDSSILNAGRISTTGDFAGGFAGYTSLGDALAVGQDSSDENKIPLVDDVVSLLKGILAGEGGVDSPLLSLLGINPSYVYGCQVSGNAVEVAGKNYVGGFTGRADGTEFGISTPEGAGTLKPYEQGKIVYDSNYTGPKSQKCTVSNLSSVTASEGYAGGFIGLAATASAGGIIDSTLVGAFNFLPVKADGVVITGTESGLVVRNTAGVAAGAVAEAVGSELTDISIVNLKEVASANNAAGFIGKAGVGGLVDAGGLNILGLISVDSLLSVAQGLQVKVTNGSVSGIGSGFTVLATEEESGVTEHRAAGFIAESTSALVTNGTVDKLNKVSTTDMENGYAGGFAAVSYTGGLADVGDPTVGEGGLVDISGLLSAVQYLIPKYTDCKVTYIEDVESQQVEAACAGGFVGKLESGTIENNAEDYTAVEQLCNVHGRDYAGGFVGFATSGGLIASRGGISILNGTLNVNVDELLNVFNFYVPVIKNASISSEAGLTVTCDGNIEKSEQAAEPQADAEGEEGEEEQIQDTDLYGSNVGCAGGYIGYGSGVQITNSDVSNLRFTTVNEPEDLQQQDGSSYFGDGSHYAVKAGRYAGGYVGKLDIGNAAAIGKNLGALNKVLELNQAVSALASVSSKIVDSDVTGDVGGYAVLADGTLEGSDKVGHAGGFAGSVDGSLIENSNAHNFAYIIGQETAGGFVGNMEPGNVAELIGDVNVLGGLASAENLLSAVQSFIPRIHSSSTDAVPCGGVVRAESASGDNGAGGYRLRGAAGGYAGHNNGGQIDGKETGAKAERIRSVYGYEYAGGFTGYLHNADLVGTGSLKLLYGLIEVSNPLTAIQAVYATETNTSVTGPLRGLSFDQFKAWYEGVGKNGAYGDDFNELISGDESNYNEKIAGYYYGYEVTAGREKLGENREYHSGTAGGYVGKMTGSIITNGQAYDLKRVEAMRSAGGFAGETAIGDLASVGGLSLADLNITSGVPVLETFVPEIKTSSVTGYKSGIEIVATGYSEQENEHIGNAGGYVGYLLGGTIMGTAESKCTVTGLKSVEGKAYVGGYAGKIQPGSLLTVDTSSSEGLLDKLLSLVIGTPDDLASLLNATMSRVEYSGVSAYSDAGFVVDGSFEEEGILAKLTGTTAYAKAAGGYAGLIEGGIIGDSDLDTLVTEHDPDAGAVVTGVKTVTGGEYAGGFVGLADVSAVAEISHGETSILGSLLGLGAIDALDAFRTYIYDSSVSGSEASGLTVTAKEGEIKENQQSGSYKVCSGNAGGFGGSVLNGTVLNSNVTGLKSVEAVNYSGGFLGHGGKSGLVDVDEINVGETGLGNLLGVSAGIADVCGSAVNECTVTGMQGGYTVRSYGGDDEIAGGFIGFGDLARMEDNHVYELKQVASDGTAAGFIGKTSFAYLVDAEINSALVEPIIKVVQGLVTTLLQTDKWPEDGIVQIEIPGLVDISGLYKDGLLSVDLLGLVISVSLGEVIDGQQQIAVHIGDSSITIQCDEDGNFNADEISNVIEVSLIKANRTRVADSSVKGTSIGYDVFGAGATNDEKGSGDGYAGGFVGYNNEGLLENNIMDLADTIKGADGKIGEFSGTSSLKSNYTELKDIEGTNNTYHVYRKWDDGKLTHIYNNSNVLSSNGAKKEIGGISYYDYSVQHMQYANMYKHNDVWNGAYQTTAKNIARFPVNVYVSGAQADLMLGTPTYANESDIEDIESEMQDPCAAEGDHTFQKVWVDDGNSGGMRPKSISVKLRPKGTPTGNADDIKIPMDSSMAGSDKDVWTTSVDAPINYADADGTIHKYDYTVTEVPIKNSSGDQTYATIYKDVDEYTHQIINYLPTELIREDTVVIDYGLSVDIDVLTNDKAAEIDGAKLAGVAIVDGETVDGETAVNTELINKVTTELDTSFTAANSEEKALTGTYGTAYIKAGENGAADEIRFTLNTMEMYSYQQIMYAVQLPDNNGQHQYVYGMVTVVPATTIYFEDNFGAIHYTDGDTSSEVTEENYTNYTHDEDWENHGIWKIAGGKEQSDVQDTDRPGESEIKAALDNVYGNDTHYENCQTYSNGTSHKTRVSQVNYPRIGGKYPKATFEFKGTGFDVISVTSGDTGAVEVVVKDSGGNALYDDIINTYYGYTATPSGTPDPTSEDVLYQIPVLKKEGLPYDKYTVEIIPVYSTFNDMNNDTYYDIYFDAVRIYDPASAAEEDYQIIEEAYNKDKENNPEYMELRDIMLNADNVTGVIQGGTVFIDGNSTLDDIKDYEDLGPKNEIYLKPGQAISFYLWASEIPDTVQISAKVALGSSTDLSIATAVNEKAETDSEDAWEYYKNRNVQINTSYDLYYDISENCEWIEAGAPAQAADEGSDTVTYQYRTRYPIVIKNPAAETDGQGNGTTEEQSVLSLTNLKWTGTVKPMGNQPGTEDGTAPGQDDDPTPNTGTEGQDPSEGNSGIQTRMAKAGARTMPVMAAEDTQDSITLMASVAPENIPAAYYFINQSDSSEEDGGQTTPGEGEEGGGQTTPGEGEEGGSQTTPGEGEEGGSQTTPETGDNNAQQKPAGQAPGNNEDSVGDPADKTLDQSGYSAVQTGDMVAAAGFAVLFAMMALSAIAASAAVYYRRKHR